MAGQSKLGSNLTEMGAHFARVVYSSRMGKGLLAIWLIGLFTASSFGVWNRLSSKKVVRVAKDDSKKQVRGSFMADMKKIVKIAFPRAFSKTSIHLVFYTLLLIFRIILTIKIAEVTGMLGKVCYFSVSRNDTLKYQKKIHPKHPVWVIYTITMMTFKTNIFVTKVL
jgi:hypothetical protein